jgi:hypothetical protein
MPDLVNRDLRRTGAEPAVGDPHPCGDGRSVRPQSATLLQPRRRVEDPDRCNTDLILDALARDLVA